MRGRNIVKVLCGFNFKLGEQNSPKLNFCLPILEILKRKKGKYVKKLKSTIN